MVTTSKNFLVDSNTLIASSRLYYHQDLIPTFWDVLGRKTKEGRIVLLDMVRDEINKGEDILKNWVNSSAVNFQICNHVDSDIISKYAEIMQYIQTSGYYNEKGLNDWAKNDVADPWLVAAASVKNYILITFEQPSGSLSFKNKSGKVKIPDIAKKFNVEVQNLYYMMRQLNIKI